MVVGDEEAAVPPALYHFIYTLMTVDSLEVRRVLVEVHLVAIARGIAPEIFRPVIADVREFLPQQGI